MQHSAMYLGVYIVTYTIYTLICYRKYIYWITLKNLCNSKNESTWFVCQGIEYTYISICTKYVYGILYINNITRVNKGGDHL